VVQRPDVAPGERSIIELRVHQEELTRLASVRQ
jgi:hypothetical protein